MTTERRRQGQASAAMRRKREGATAPLSSGAHINAGERPTAHPTRASHQATPVEPRRPTLAETVYKNEKWGWPIVR